MLSVLRKWVEEHNIEPKIEYDSEFYYDISDDVIGVAIDINYAYEDFVEYALSLGLRYNPGPWVLAFFHEVGHYFTLENDDLDEAWDDYLDKLDTFKLADYLCHPIEHAATQWAVDYINNNENEIIQMVKDIDKAMNSNVLEVYVNGTKMEAC